MTPLLLVSGWAHTAEALQPLADRLARHRAVRVSAIHELVVGSDRSDRSDRSNFSCYAAGLVRELERENGPCVLAGWSMGGMIALEAAVACPDRVAALILISSAPRLAAAPDFPEGVPLRTLRAMQNGLRKTPERTLGAFFRNAAFPVRPDTHTLSGRIMDALGLGTEQLAEQLRYLLETDLRVCVAGLSVPTLALHGRLDRIIPVVAAARITGPPSRVRMEKWEDTGHSLPLQHSERVAARMLDFFKIARHERPSP